MSSPDNPTHEFFGAKLEFKVTEDGHRFPLPLVAVSDICLDADGTKNHYYNGVAQNENRKTSNLQIVSCPGRPEGMDCEPSSCRVLRVKVGNVLGDEVVIEKKVFQGKPSKAYELTVRAIEDFGLRNL